LASSDASNLDVEIGQRHHATHQPRSQRLCRVGDLARQQQPRGARVANQARHQRRVNHRRNAYLDLRHTQLGVVGGDADIARQRQFQAAAEAPARHPCNHGYREDAAITSRAMR
jgi:hypothetical protein